MNRRICPVSCFVALGLFPACALGIDNLAEVAITPNFPGGSGPADVVHSGTGPQDSAASATGGFSSSGSGTAHVDYGHIRLADNGGGSLHAVSRCYMRDMVTITAPGVPNGTTGSLTYSVTLSGWFSASSGSSGAGYGLQCSVGGGVFDMGHQGNQYSPELGGAFTGDAPGIFTGTHSFQFGFPFVLDVELTASANPGNGTTGSGAAAEEVSLLWGGIGSIKINGSEVANPVITSDSGTNWGPAATPPPPDCPDTNHDGVTNTLDLGGLLSHFGQSVGANPSAASSDFNHDGVVNTLDLGILLGHYGQSCP